MLWVWPSNRTQNAASIWLAAVHENRCFQPLVRPRRIKQATVEKESRNAIQENSVAGPKRSRNGQGRPNASRMFPDSDNALICMGYRERSAETSPLAVKVASQEAYNNPGVRE